MKNQQEHEFLHNLLGDRIKPRGNKRVDEASGHLLADSVLPIETHNAHVEVDIMRVHGDSEMKYKAAKQ